MSDKPKVFKEDLNLAMANAFEELRSQSARCFNDAYDGNMDKDRFIEQMNWIKQMCDTRKDRIEAIELNP
jgi:hypothetical protein